MSHVEGRHRVLEGETRGPSQGHAVGLGLDVSLVYRSGETKGETHRVDLGRVSRRDQPVVGERRDSSGSLFDAHFEAFLNQASRLSLGRDITTILGRRGAVLVFLLVILAVVFLHVGKSSECFVLDSTHFLHLVCPSGLPTAFLQRDPVCHAPLIALLSKHISLGAKASQKSSSEETLVPLSSQVSDGTVDNSSFARSAVIRQSRKQTSQVDKLPVERFSALSLDSIMLMSLFGGIDTLSRFVFGLSWSSRGGDSGG